MSFFKGLFGLTVLSVLFLLPAAMPSGWAMDCKEGDLSPDTLMKKNWAGAGMNDSKCMRNGIFEFAVNQYAPIVCSPLIAKLGEEKTACKVTAESCKAEVEKLIWDRVATNEGEGCREAKADECVATNGKTFGVKVGGVDRYLSCDINNLVSWQNICEMVANGRPYSTLDVYNSFDDQFWTRINDLSSRLLYSCFTMAPNRPALPSQMELLPSPASPPSPIQEIPGSFGGGGEAAPMMDFRRIDQPALPSPGVLNRNVESEIHLTPDVLGSEALNTTCRLSVTLSLDSSEMGIYDIQWSSKNAKDTALNLPSGAMVIPDSTSTPIPEGPEVTKRILYPRDELGVISLTAIGLIDDKTWQASCDLGALKSVGDRCDVSCKASPSPSAPPSPPAEIGGSGDAAPREGFFNRWRRVFE